MRPLYNFVNMKRGGKTRPSDFQETLVLFLHLFLVLLDQCLLDIVRHELIT